MFTTRPTSADSVFQRPQGSASKLFSFKELLSPFRSILQSCEKDPGLPSGIQPERSTADPGPAVGDRGLSGENDPGGPRVDALEVLLAAAAPPMRAPPTEGNLPELTGKVLIPSLMMEPVLIEQVVRRLLIGGDRRRGVARIDLDGEYAGTTVWVRGEGRAVELEVILGPNLSADGLPERLLGRLRARGLEVASLEVR